MEAPKYDTQTPAPEPMKRRGWQDSARYGQGWRAVQIALLAVLGLVWVLAGGARAQGAPALDASTMGEWAAPMPWPLVGVHAAVLPTGKVLHFSYPQSGSGAAAWLWDPQTGALTEVPVGRNLFCSGHSFLPDGTLLVTGGTDPQSPSLPYGLKDIHSFDPSTETWSYVGDTQVGRWYPTNVTLPDGRILVLSGLDEQGQLTDLVEIYDRVSGSQIVQGANKLLNLYPWMHVLPSGELFHAGPESLSSTFNPATGTWQPVGFNNYGYREGGSSVLLPLQPPDYRPKVLILGGGNPATNTAEIIDLGEPSPTWSFTAPMNYARRHVDPVLLPDGKLLAVGGTPVANDATQAVLTPELFDPETETWTELASRQRPRIYHSTAVLLPDGRVLAAGTDGEFTAEIFSPPYLFQGPRPEISSAPEAVFYGSSFQTSSPDAQDISKVVLIRPAAMTHSVNMEQRYVELEFQAGTSLLTVQAPPNANLAPPGYYMMFIINSAGVPSVATFIQLGATTDNDGDGLTNDEEIGVYGTDPQVADTDGDGLSDGDEVNVYGTNPLAADTDGDGFNDGAEVFMGTLPLVSCGANAWPPDLNDDGAVAINDITGSLAPHFGAIEGVDPTGSNPGDYNPRVDLNQDGFIAINDITGPFAPHFGKSCT